MDEHLRRLERLQDLDGLERLEGTGVRSSFLEEVRQRSRRGLLRVLREALHRRTRLVVDGKVLSVYYAGKTFLPWWVQDVYLYLAAYPGLGGSLRVYVEKDGVRRWDSYWWGGHWIKFEIETNLRGDPRRVDLS